MKLLQKILFVVIVGIIAGNADGLQFSDPRLPLPPLAVNPGGGIPNGSYADFAVAGGHHIYFPHNGSLLAAHNVGQLACANTDVGNINSAVTQWYIEAFGGNAGLTAAYGIGLFVAAGLPQMGAADVIVVNAGGGAPLNFAQEFWQEFRAIASTVAGRELLYKILIEIRRIETTHNQHCYASGTERVGGMSLTVTHHAGNTAFVNKASITFDNAHHAQLQGVLEQYYSFLTTLATLPNDPHNPALQTPHFVDENAINVPGATTANDQFTRVQIPLGGGHNADIYFPIDGHQPTTPNAVAWSCANIDNRENSPITDWYMKMFGVIPFQNTGVPANDYIKAGWDNAAPPAPHTPHRIINYGFMETFAADLQQLDVLYAALPVAAPLLAIPQLAGTALAGITVAQVLTKEKKSIAQLIIDLENILLAPLANAPGVAATNTAAGLATVPLRTNISVIAVRDAAVGAGWAPSNIQSAVSYAQRVANAAVAAIPAGLPVATDNACRQVANAALGAAEQAKNIFQILQNLELLSKQMSSDDTVVMFVNKLEASFKRNFRKIASTSVGRTLLYRILMEIRRHQTAANNVGCLENGILHGGLIDDRNSLRKITIDFGDFVFDFRGKIFTENSLIHFNYVIGNSAGIGHDNKYDHIIKHKNHIDITLFHEMTHWYHALRHINRIINEINGEENIRHFDGVARDVNGAPVMGGAPVVPPGSEAAGHYYWNILPAFNVDDMLISETKWGIDSRANYEEIRNILGVPVDAGGAHPIANTKNGDDLSENLYRMCVGEPLRLGHVYNGFEFYEDSKVVDKITESCSMQKANYNCIIRANGNTEFTYGSGIKGIGGAELF